MSWLTDIIDQHKEVESPVSFWYWSALTALSAVVKDNVWSDRQLYNLYPNIYVMLYADSGLKKGPPINMAKRLVRLAANTRVISGRSSIQGILADLGTAYTLPGGQVIDKPSAFIVSSELTSSLVEDPAALDILTDIYDRSYNEEEYRSLLKMGQFSLKAPTVSLLGGINEAHAEKMFGKKDIQGGYFARSFIIHESQRNKLNSLVRKLTNPPNYDTAAAYLKEIAKIKGKFHDLDETEAGEIYHNWYMEFYDNIDKQKIKDPTGTLNRFGDSVLKVAMLISLSSSFELVISADAMIEAISQCEKLVGNARRVTMSSGKGTYTVQKAALLEELLTRDNHMISRAQLNKKFWMHASSVEWDDIIESMAAGGFVLVEKAGANVMYRMPDEQVKDWQKHLRGK
jgi:hypothetical protein